MSFHIVPERPEDAVLNEPLLDRTFGFERKQKTVYRLRDGIAPVTGLSFSAVSGDGALLGSLRFWPIVIDAVPAILLGPLAVERALQGLGIGKALLASGLTEARRQGHRICVVVGAPDYYRPFGFRAASGAGLILPGPVEPERFQVSELVPGALDGTTGLVGRVPDSVAARTPSDVVA